MALTFASFIFSPSGSSISLICPFLKTLLCLPPFFLLPIQCIVYTSFSFLATLQPSALFPPRRLLSAALFSILRDAFGTCATFGMSTMNVR